MAMQAKPTLYAGYRFRSKLEAKWAVFFDELKIPYQYEPEAFVCSDGSQYTPDFFLPKSYLRDWNSIGLYLEIKPFGWQYEDKYADRIASAFGENDNLVLFSGEPFDILAETVEGNYQLSPSWDNYMEIQHCEKCGVLKAEFMESNYCHCPLCDGKVNTGAAQRAAEKARQYRFEFQPNTSF